MPPPLLGDPEVLRVLLARRGARSRPGARQDPHRVALVLGGGGMRGAYVAGMVRALERAGLRDGFDEVYGASSGAMIGAAFVTGDADGCARAFPEDLTTRAFIDLRRLGTRRPVVSLDHLLHGVLDGTKPLAWADLPGSTVPLRVIATAHDDLTPHPLHATSADEWRRALRASIAIPLLAGRPVAYAGRSWVDGSVGEPLAVARALRGGATHVLVLLCRGETELHPDPDAPLSAWARLLDRAVPGLGSIAQGSRRYGSDLRIVTDAAHPARGPAHLLALGPARSAGFGALCVERGPIGEAVEIGDTSAQAALAAVGELDPA